MPPPVNPYSILPEDLSRYSDIDGVDIFRKLLWAETGKLGIPKSSLRVPFEVRAPDGGIDAEVLDSPSSSDLIRKGKSCYQIKTGKFSPLNQNDLKKSFLRCGKLLPKIQEHWQAGGAYYLICFGWKGAGSNPDILGKIKKIIPKQHRSFCKAPFIYVLGADQIIHFFQSFPGLVSEIKGQKTSHHFWSQNQDMNLPFHADDKIKRKIENIQNALIHPSEPSKAVHLHLWGQPGAGKTRIALEATRHEYLKPLVVYFENPEKLLNGNGHYLIQEVVEKPGIHACFVVDECDSPQADKLRNQLFSHGSRIKLVTIYNQQEKPSSPTNSIEIPSAESSVLCDILKEFSIPEEQVQTWAKFCDGSPRFARILGEAIRANPKDFLQSPSLDRACERVIEGYGKDKQNLNKAKAVLTRCALFTKFGYDSSYHAEAEVIQKWCETEGVTPIEFKSIIQTFRKRKILQGQGTLYLSPFPFHLWLWMQYWEHEAQFFSFEMLFDNTQRVPEKLFGWFCDMLKYAAETHGCADKVKELFFSNQSPLKSGERKSFLDSEKGSHFFFRVSEALPSEALSFLQDTLADSNKEALVQFKKGRRNVVYALERIVMWRDCFEDAAEILLRFAETENESWSNNATGVFVELFQIARTLQIPLSERMEWLFATFQKSNAERKSILLKACASALNTHSSATGGLEKQGLGKVPDLHPQTWGEIYDYWKTAWEKLNQFLDVASDPEKQEITQILLRHARSLLKLSHCTGSVLQTLQKLAQSNQTDSNELLETLVHILRYEKKRLPLQTLETLQRLQTQLIGHDFHSLLRRYAGMHMTEDFYDENMQPTTEIQNSLGKLAKEAVADSEKLKKELHWLATSEAKNGYQFGYALGLEDQEFSLRPMLSQAQALTKEKGSLFFLGGYFRALFESDPDRNRWENVLDLMAESPESAQWAPELTWRSGMTDRAALRLLRLAQHDAFNPNLFGLFRMGGTVAPISEPVFLQWIDFLIQRPDYPTASIALDLFSFYYGAKKKEPERPIPEKDLPLKILLHPAFFQKRGEDGENSRNQMDDYHWTQLARAALKKFPEITKPIREMLFKHFGQDGAVLHFNSEAHSVLEEIARMEPAETWKSMALHLTDSKGFWICQWLRESAIGCFPPAVVFDWVDQDQKKRAHLLARDMIPNGFFHPEKSDEICWARETLRRYGRDKDVRRAFDSNYFTESYSGHSSMHYRKKQELLLEFKSRERDLNVLRWVNEQIDNLKKSIQHSEKEEERQW